MRATVRGAVAVGAAGVVVLGVWVTGGLLTDDAGVAKAATAGWFGTALVAAVLVARRWRPLALPVLAATGLTVASVGAALLWTSTVDKVVVEEVAVAATGPARAPTAAGRTTTAGRPPGPARTTPAGTTPVRTTPVRTTPVPPPGPVLLARGAFRAGEHATTGTAALLRRPDRTAVVTLTDLDTSPGPDLRVYLVPRGGSIADAVDAGRLRGNRGTQQYAVPPGTDPARVGAVVIWCRAFSVAFGTAELRPPA